MSQRRSDDDTVNGANGSISARLAGLESQLTELLGSPVIRFDDRCRSALPEARGIYRIFDPTKPGETVRAGCTKTAAGGLRQRVYQNHLMGNQAGPGRGVHVDRGELAARLRVPVGHGDGHRLLQRQGEDGRVYPDIRNDAIRYRSSRY